MRSDLIRAKNICSHNTTKNMDKLYLGDSSYYAHSKGGLVYDNDTGAFLLTSLPRYPTRDSENNLYIEMPNNTGIYAQDFLCISIEKKTSEKIVELFTSCLHKSSEI